MLYLSTYLGKNNECFMRLRGIYVFFMFAPTVVIYDVQLWYILSGCLHGLKMK